MALYDPLHLPWKPLADLAAAEATRQDGKPRAVIHAKAIWLRPDTPNRAARQARLECMGGFFVIPVEDLPMFVRPRTPDSVDDL